MTPPRHHPASDELLAYASGASAEWLGLVVACHLTYCSRCRDEVRLLEDIGGALLDTLKGLSNGNALDAAQIGPLRKVGPAQRYLELQQARPRSIPGLPWPLEGFYRDSSPVWQSQKPGVDEIPLNLSANDIPVRLVRLQPGYVIAEHYHQDLEFVLVFSGALEDVVAEDIYRTGDLSRREETSAHSLRVSGEERCVCLVVTLAPTVPARIAGAEG